MSHKNTQVFQAQKQHRPCASNTALVSVLVKIQQPVTTSTYTKYGQRYWRQPATKTQNKRNLDKRDSDSFPQHNKEGTNSIVTCCYVGSSVHLLVLRNNMHSCMTSIKSSDRSNLLEKLQVEIKLQKHVSVLHQSSQIIQTCKVSLKSK